ncbi:MAG TPA: Gfo/Idh/MocA family oxidoreductase, partial [Candidatus Hydrogenedentes bacterium]|nr:Gfo/Idh/MocA family oxidoreductase [Candidatus Hydrogenedentota bacterium]
MDVTRRNFMKAAGTTAGVMIATGWSPLAYAQNEKVRLAIIGTGSQNKFHIENGIAGNPQIQITAMADVLKPSLATGLASVFPPPVAGAPADVVDKWKAARAEFSKHLYLDYRQMLEKEKDNIDAVLIATPFKTHYDIVMDCLDAGKHVFCEKTMADTYERCRNIVTKCHETGKFVQCGHQRRYNPEYLHAIKGLEEQRIGRVQYIEGQWHRNGDWRRPLPKKVDGTTYQLSPQEAALVGDEAAYRKLVNWRIYEQYSAGLISELATHHIEVVNWMLGTPPKRVWATGGIDYWRDDRDTLDNVILVFEYDVNPRHRGFITTSPKTGGDPLSPVDPVKMQKPYTVRFTWTGTLQSSFKGESILMCGDNGAYIL